MRSTGRVVRAIGAAACAVSLAVSLAGCAYARPTAGAPDPGLRGDWVLVSGNDTFGPIKLLGQDMTLSITDGAVSTGRSSCSDYSARIYGAPRNLWVTTDVPPNYRCATADQSVLQLEYLLDLARVTRSSVTTRGLDLSGQGVELAFHRAPRLPLAQLVNTSWQLRTSGIINLHSPFSLQPETGGSIRFISTSALLGETTCEDFTAHYAQVGDQLVAGSVMAIRNLGCNRATDRAAADFVTVFENGFSYSLGTRTLTLTSTRAGVYLGFNEEAP